MRFRERVTVAAVVVLCGLAGFVTAGLGLVRLYLRFAR